MNAILRKVEELGLNASGHIMKFSGCTWYKIEFGKEKSNLEALSKKGEPHERNPCAPSSEEQPPEETSRQADCTSKEAWNLARKYASSSRRQLRFILLWRRQRHRRSCACYRFGSFNAQCWARRIELRYNGYFEKVQKPHMRLAATGVQCK